MWSRIGQGLLVALVGIGLYAMPEEPRGVEPPRCLVVVQGCGQELQVCAQGACGPKADRRAQEAWRAQGGCAEGRVTLNREANACEATGAAMALTDRR